MINWTQAHLIMEYSIMDKLGRNKGWHMQGIVSSLESAREILSKIQTENAGKTVEMRVYEYTQAFGSRQIA